MTKKRQPPKMPTSTARSTQQTTAHSYWIVALFALATGIYLFCFYAVQLPSLQLPGGPEWHRIEVLRLVLVPEVAWQLWTGESGHVAWLDRLPILAWSAAIWSVMILTGWSLLELSRWDLRLTRVERWVFSGALGAGAWSAYTLLVGLGGGLHSRSWFWGAAGGVAVVVLILAVRRRMRLRAQDGPAPEQVAGGARRYWWAWMAAATPFVVFYLLAGILPPTDFDVREYHLQVPKEFYKQGYVGFLPHNIYGNMPLGSEMLTLLSMVLVGDWWIGALTGKVVLAGFAPLTALALWAAGCRFIRPAAGGMAALVYLSTPWIFVVSTSGLVEGASACYWLLAVYALLLWWRSADAHVRTARVSLSGLMVGAALGIKYPAALFVLAPLAGSIVWIEGRRCWKPLTLFLAFTCVLAGPWLAKNWVLAGNPTYPLLYQVFGGETRTPEKDAQWRAAHDPPNYAASDFGRRLVDFTLRSEWLNPLLIPLVVLGLLTWWRDVGWVVVLYVVLVVVLWWLFTHRIDRFWVPIMAILALIAGASVEQFRGRALAWAGYGVVAVLLLANLVTITSGACGDNRYFVELSRLRNDEVRVPTWYQYLNQHAPPDQYVLSVGDAAIFDLQMPVLYNTTFDDNIFERLVRPALEDSTDKAFQELRDRLSEVSYVYVHWGEIARYRSPGNYGFTEFVQPEVFRELVAQGVLGPPVAEFSGTPVQIFPVLPPVEGRSAQ